MGGMKGAEQDGVRECNMERGEVLKWAGANDLMK